ncbi:MAG: hypothetical protein L3K19_08920 [Thermoplasmata archaeon]|nr:hypothetical protein [Thermoplasmata archaeon]
MSEKDGGEARAEPRETPPAPRYRRPGDEVVREAARRVLRGGHRAYASQEELRRAVIPILRREDALYSVGGRRLRRLLLATRGVKIVVRYREVPSQRPLTECPVCDGELAPIRNQTLFGERVVLGFRCTRCSYWTHLKRRVPVRYSFVVGSRSARTIRSADP